MPLVSELLRARDRGIIGGRPASLSVVDGRLMFRLGRRVWDTAEITVDHRNSGPLVRFSIYRDGGLERRIRYRRRGPSWWDWLMGWVDFTAEEPWTWEDSDYGLFVFNVIEGIGPLKYRHRFEGAGRAFGKSRVVIDDESIRRTHGVRGRTERVTWASVFEVAAKFELEGHVGEPTVFMLRGPAAVCVVPIRGPEAVPRGFAAKLRELPGFDAASELQYSNAARFGQGEDTSMQELPTRAERIIWRRSS